MSQIWMTFGSTMCFESFCLEMSSPNHNKFQKKEQKHKTQFCHMAVWHLFKGSIFWDVFHRCQETGSSAAGPGRRRAGAQQLRELPDGRAAENRHRGRRRLT